MYLHISSRIRYHRTPAATLHDSLLLQNEEELESTAKANPHPFILIKGTYTDPELCW